MYGWDWSSLTWPTGLRLVFSKEDGHFLDVRVILDVQTNNVWLLYLSFTHISGHKARNIDANGAVGHVLESSSRRLSCTLLLRGAAADDHQQDCETCCVVLTFFLLTTSCVYELEVFKCNEEYSLGTRSGTRCGSLSGHDLLLNYADKLTYLFKCVIMYDKNHSKLGYYHFFI